MEATNLAPEPDDAHISREQNLNPEEMEKAADDINALQVDFDQVEPLPSGPSASSGASFREGCGGDGNGTVSPGMACCWTLPVRPGVIFLVARRTASVCGHTSLLVVDSSSKP